MMFFEMHDAYRPRVLGQSEWIQWARYSYHHTPSAKISSFTKYLEVRRKNKGASRLPTQDIFIESFDGENWNPYSIVLQEVENQTLRIDYISVCLDDVDDHEERILETANVIQVARKFSIECRDVKSFPPFKSIVLNTTVGNQILKAASTLPSLYKVIEPCTFLGQSYRFELSC